MHFHVITLFPEVCQAYTDASIIARAQKTNKGKGAKTRGRKITINYYNPRDFSKNKHQKVDDRPYGGGPGMVLAAPPLLAAWQKAVGRKRNQNKVKTIILSPRGQPFTNQLAKRYAAKYNHLVLVSGRYEGIDTRVQKALKADLLQVGECVLTGGELPALYVVDAVARHVPGVLGEARSLEDARVTTGETYTRPESITFKNKKLSVPQVFLSGHHAKINQRRAN